MGYLSNTTFYKVIENTPLVSIDLIVTHEHGSILLGKRTNAPARNFWFVPGGRIRKNEMIEDAFKRLTLCELGKEYSINQAQLIGPYTHLYNDSVFGNELDTHYVVLAYQLKVNKCDLALPLNEQHKSYCWLSKSKLLEYPDVHVYTKNYFN